MFAYTTNKENVIIERWFFFSMETKRLEKPLNITKTVFVCVLYACNGMMCIHTSLSTRSPPSSFSSIAFFCEHKIYFTKFFDVSHNNKTVLPFCPSTSSQTSVHTKEITLHRIASLKHKLENLVTTLR